MHVQGCLILSQVGLLFPVNHAPESGVPGRLRSGDLLLEKQACGLDYTTGTERIKPLAGLFHRLTSRERDRSSCFAFRGSNWLMIDG